MSNDETGRATMDPSAALPAVLTSEHEAGEVIRGYLTSAIAVLRDESDGADRREASALLRRAIGVVESERREGRPHPEDPVVASTLGCELVFASRQDRAPEERWLEAEDILRKAVEWSSSGDSAIYRRRLNLLACVHQRLEIAPVPERTQDLVHELAEITSSCFQADPPEQVAAWRSLGHAKGLLSTFHTDDKALALLVEALGHYEHAEQIAEASGAAGVNGADVALIHERIHKITGQLDHLHQAIALATRTLDECSPADSHRPIAEMQLAMMLRVRYETTGDERDLRRALRLSSQSVNSWFVERGSGLQQSLERQRLLVLATAMLRPGDWTDEQAELRDLLIRYPLPAGVEVAPDETMFHLWAAFCAAIENGEALGTFSEADAAGDAMSVVVGAATDVEIRVRWRTELAICQLRLVAVRGRQGRGTPCDGSGLQRMALALQADAADPLLTARVRFRALVIAAEVWFQVACIGEVATAAARRSSDTAAAAVAVGAEAGVSHGDLAQAIALARRANAHLGRSNPPEVGIAVFLREVNAIDAAIKGPDALLISGRQRGAMAGEVAVCIDEPAEASWVHLALSSGLDLFDERTREVEKASTAKRSEEAVQVFLNLGSTKSRADVCRSGQWSQVDLPGLTGDALMHRVGEAYLAYEHIASGVLSGAWATSRSSLLDHVTRLLAPLVDDLRGSEAVELYLSGWARTVPLVPVLSAALGHQPTVVEVLATQTTSAAGRLSRFGAIAAPGDPATPLPSAIDDAKEALAMFGSSPEGLVVDPGAQDFLTVIRRCTTFLFAGHALASRRDPGDSAVLLRSSEVSAASLLGEDLSHVDLAVLAACETMAPDGQIPQRPLSVAAAMLFAGVAAVAGSHWRVSDAHASAFALALLRSRARGDTVACSYRAALRKTASDGPWFTVVLNRRVSRMVN